MTYEQAVKKLLAIPKFSDAEPLEHIKRLLNALGNPEEAFEVIHVAGTNGKGSVCTYLNNILIESGRKTGLFISPHLVTINERVLINNHEITDKDFAETFQIVEKAADKQTNFFEFLFAMACVYFKKRGVRTAIIETGMGGRLDATNAVKNPRMCIICKIGLDHTEILGDTLEKIAAEKAGIIKRDSIVVYWADLNSDGTLKNHSQIIAETADNLSVKSVKVSQSAQIITRNNKSMQLLLDKNINLSVNIKSAAAYQAQNAAVAYAAAKELKIPKEVIKRGFENTFIRGRMQEISENVFVDGAHNTDGIDTFLESVKQLNITGEKILIFGALKDKNLFDMTAAISRFGFDKVYVCEIDNPRAASAGELSEFFINKKVTDIKVCDKSFEALKSILSSKEPHDAVFVCGSLYLVGEILSHVKKFNI